ncbi:tRNA-uridine aminocarboxypropyltransferase 1-like isoform X2 [Oculina patagonica]
MADKPDGSLSPFSDLKIASHEVLRGLERRPCPKCQASRKYYCYVCYVTVGLDRSLIPTVNLPIKVDIIKHQGELVGKSTATHACILAPGEVTIYNYPEVPKFQEKEKVIIVFPSEDAITLEMIRQNHDRQTQHLADTSAVLHRVVFIDSTWQQCHRIITDKKLEKLQKVKLESAVTHFWRPQRKKPDTCLATIEAIYYFFKEYDQHILKRAYDGRYDNLLYFFAFQYNLIQEEQLKR